MKFEKPKGVQHFHCTLQFLLKSPRFPSTKTAQKRFCSEKWNFLPQNHLAPPYTPPGTIGNSGFDISSVPHLFDSPNDLLKTVSIIPLFSGFAESLTYGLPHPCAFGRLRRHLCCAQERTFRFGRRKNPSAAVRFAAFMRCGVSLPRRKKLTPAYARAFPHSMIWSPERPQKSSEPQFRKEIKPYLLDDFSRRALTSAML